MNLGRATFILFTLFLFSLSSALVQGVDYSIVVKDHGQTVVIGELGSHTRVNLTVPNDAIVKGKGALYLLEQKGYEKLISAYTGSVTKGIIAYSTQSYTTKSGEIWTVSIDLKDATKVDVVLPKEANVRLTNPKAVIDGNTVSFIGTDNVFIEYQFVDRFSIGTDFLLIGIAGIFGGLILFGGYFVFRNPRKDAKDNVIKTLPKIERRILDELIASKGNIKRNYLEKKTKISKSSLANALNNLEKKGIVEIDKSFTVHTVKFSEWFRKL